MSNILWQRLGAASGIVYVVVLLGPDLIQGGPSEEPTMTAAEAKFARDHIGKAKSRREGFEDIGWALLNTKEFLFNH